MGALIRGGATFGGHTIWCINGQYPVIMLQHLEYKCRKYKCPSSKSSTSTCDKRVIKGDHIIRVDPRIRRNAFYET